MQANSRLLTEAESASLAGVTLETIRQYGDFGLLQPIVRDEQVFFQESEIRSLFYTRAPRAAQITPQEQEPSPNKTTLEAEQNAETESNAAAQNTHSAQSGNGQQPVSSAAPDSPGQTDAQPKDAVQPQLQTHEAQASSPSAELAQLNETNRSLREQVEILREERNWLRERIEKLESRSEREQMLLMSESETVRNLIRNKEGARRSFLGLALPWFGFTNEEKRR
jgi:hypothetical protein